MCAQPEFEDGRKWAVCLMVTRVAERHVRNHWMGGPEPGMALLQIAVSGQYGSLNLERDNRFTWYPRKSWTLVETPRVTEVTRRDIIDQLILRDGDFYGHLDQVTFLARVWDLTTMPSTDRREPNLDADLRRHISWGDHGYDDAGVLYGKLEIIQRPDEEFGRFLAACLHPIVQRNPVEVSELLGIFNNSLAADGFILSESARVSGLPVYAMTQNEAPGAVRTPHDGCDDGAHAYHAESTLMPNDELKRISQSFATLPVKDEPNRTRLLNELETVVRLHLPDDAGRYVKQARAIHFYPIAYTVPGPDYTPRTWAEGKSEIVALIASIEHHLDLLNKVERQSEVTVPRAILISSKVFIVHGHDRAMLSSVEAFVSRIGLEAIVLAEEANQGRTLLEKFEEHGDVGYAVVLLSPDDIGRSASANRNEEKLRPRQNVVLELGYFVGRLGRKHVAALVNERKDDVVEYPSDIRGIATIQHDANGNWKRLLAREFRAAQLIFRENKV
jgi:predicted nucleotide-binding protein